MSDFLNNVISILLVFVAVVLAPLMLCTLNNDMISERLILNDTSEFLDKVTDKGYITEDDLESFYAQVNSYSLVVNANVSREVRGETKFGDEIRTVYIRVDDTSVLNSGDMIRVTIKEVGKSNAKILLYNLLKIIKPRFEVSLVSMVR